jgi:molybdopterin-guanine dinucleotide biosynthesis protein A
VIPINDITGLLLAGGRGSRMGGVDKGLQLLLGERLAWHVFARLRPQVATLLISANRHREAYLTLGVPVLPDGGIAAPDSGSGCGSDRNSDRNSDRDSERGSDRNALANPTGQAGSAESAGQYAGPLAGILAGMRFASTPYLLVAPCDTPFIPPDLGQRLAAALAGAGADIAMVTTRAGDKPAGVRHSHPVTALLSTSLAGDLEAFLRRGEHKVGAWYARHTMIEVPFPEERAFYNVNTLQQLHDPSSR